MRTISPFEFVRRFHHGVTNHDGRFVWFLGAGCSVSSGIADAADTTQRWLRELKYLETGDTGNIEDWAARRFPDYDSGDVARLYRSVLNELFYTGQEQERELERINATAEPGFGYATLAQLVTHAKWGERCNTIVTTNFDDLAADALYLYSQQRPQVLTHESFDRRIRISTARPTILKVYGDAHLAEAGGAAGDSETLLRPDVKDRLRAQFTESSLIFVGYGGRDECVRDLLEGLPSGAPAGGIFWINAREPAPAMLKWLEGRNAVSTPYSDFEGLMFLIRREFQLGHPRIDRFDQILKRYDAQFRALAAREDLQQLVSRTPRANGEQISLELPNLDDNPFKLAQDEAAPADAGEEVRNEAAAAASFASISTSDVTWASGYRDSFGADDVIPHGEIETAIDEGASGDVADAAGSEPPNEAAPLTGGGIPHGRIDKLIAAAVEAMASEQRDVERVRAEAAAAADEQAAAMEQVADAAPVAANDAAEQPVDAVAEVEVEAEDQPEPARTDNVANFPGRFSQPLELPRRLLGRSDAAELDRRYLAALKDAPNNPKLLARYAQFLATGRRDHDGAEHYFNRAIDADPQDAAVLRAFAVFLTETRRDYERAEDCYRLALRADFEDTATLCDYASFLWKARGDLQAAGECFQVAVDGAPRDSRALSLYARFLREVEGNEDAAYALLKLAVASTRTDPAPAVELAQFLATSRNEPEKAEATFRHAMRVAPASAETLSLAAEFFADRLGKLDEAEAVFRDAMSADADDALVLRRYAAFRARHRNDIEGAERLLTGAFDADPGNAGTALDYARFLEERKEDADGADEYYRRAVHLDPRDAGALAAHARFLERVRGNPAAAEERFRKALKLEPKNPQVMAAFGHFLLNARDDTDAAEPLLRAASAAMPSDAGVLADLGKLLRERGDLSGSEEMFRRAVEADPRRASAYRRIIRVTGSDVSPAPGPDASVPGGEPRRAERSDEPAALGGAAQAMFAAGRADEGISLLNRAFEAALGVDPADRDPDLLLELWFSRFVFHADARPDAAKALSWLVKSGARMDRKEVDALIDCELARKHPDPVRLNEIADLVSGTGAADNMSKFNVA